MAAVNHAGAPLQAPVRGPPSPTDEASQSARGARAGLTGRTRDSPPLKTVLRAWEQGLTARL